MIYIFLNRFYSDDQMKNELGRTFSTMGTGEVHTWFRSGDPMDDHLEIQDVCGRIILKWISKKWDWVTWIGLLRFRIGKSGGHL